MAWSLGMREVILNSSLVPLPIYIQENPQNIEVDRIWFGGGTLGILDVLVSQFSVIESYFCSINNSCGTIQRSL